MATNEIIASLFQGYMPAIYLAGTAVLLLLSQRLNPQMDPREPPLAKPTVPLIGHLIGMIRHQAEYIGILCAKTPHPEFTMPILGSKTYVITSPSAVQDCLRKKTLSFEPFVQNFAERELLITGESLRIVKHTSKDESESYLLKDFHTAIHTSLAVGPGVQRMNATVLSSVADIINSIDSNNGLEVSSFYLWLRNALTFATSKALFGIHDPLGVDPSLCEAAWDFEAGLPVILINIFPSITCSAAHKARAKMQAALQKYYVAGYDTGPTVGSVVTARAASMRKHGLPNSEIGRFEISLIHAATANAIPTLFWLLTHILSDPQLQEEIALEVEAILKPVTPSTNGKRRFQIDTSLIASQCPLLSSVYQESMRLSSASISTRVVLEDTLISDGDRSYLLKKDGIVQLPGTVTHVSTATWGPDAESFNPRRFMKSNSKVTDQQRQQRRALIPFGGGQNLCPGRHFAYAEILGMAAVMAVGCKAEGIRVPGKTEKRVKFADSTYKPIGTALTMRANITRRKGWEDVTWSFTTGMERE